MSVVKKLTYGLVIFLVCTFALHAILVLSFPFDVRGGCEGQVLSQSVNLIRGQAYRPIESSPFHIEVYPPGFPLVAGVFSLVFGETLFTGRMVSLLASLISGGMLYLFLRNLSVGRGIPVLFGLTFLISSPVFHWGVLNRVDMLALCFSLLGLYLFLGGKKCLSIVFFNLAFFVKPTFGIAPPLACIFWLICQKSRIQATRYASLLFSTIAIACFLLFLYTKGQFPYQLLLQGACPFSVASAGIDVVYFILFNILFFALAFCHVLLRRGSLFSFYLLFSFFVLVATIGKEGSDINYFIEPTAALLLCAGASFSDLLIYGRKKWSSLLFCLILLQLLISNPIFRINSHVRLESFGIPDRGKAQKVYEHIKKSRGNILVEDGEYAILSKKTAFLTDPVLLSAAAMKGKWNVASFLSMCERKEFSVIAYYWRFDLIPGFSECLHRHYSLVDEFDQTRGLGTVALPHITKGIFHLKYHWKIYQPKNEEEGRFSK